MNNTGRTIARNASVLMASQLLTWALALVLTVFMPRYLGAVNVGKIALANSVWAIAAIMITFGMDTLITKQVARQHDQAPHLFGTTIVVRAVLYGVGLAGITAYLRVFNYPGDTVLVVYIVGIGSLTWQMIGAVQAVLQGVERMEFISIGVVIGKIVNTVGGITMLLLGQSVFVIAGVGVVAALVTLAVQLWLLRRIMPVRLRIDLKAARAMLKASVPYLLSGVFLVAYQQVDIIVISLLVNERTLGWYSASGQLYATFLFIPNVFMMAIFPALSRMYASDSTSLPKLMRKSFDLLLVVSLPIGLGLFVVAQPLVLLLFGPDFAQSGPILMLMGIVLILTYQNMLIGQFLISTDRQNQWTAVMAIATIATLPIDLVAVPWCQQAFGNGGLGGAVSYLITEGGMLIAGLMMLPRGSLGRSNAWAAARAMAAALAMAAAAWAFRDQFIVLPILAGAVVYPALILLLRVVPREDQALLLGAVAGIARRFRRARPAPQSPGKPAA